MKRLFAWGTALLLVGGMQAALLPVDEPITPVDYVSTLVGTQSKHALSTGIRGEKRCVSKFGRSENI